MTLARDASSPAVALGAYSGALSDSQASNSFSPPAGAVIIVTAFAENGYAPTGWATTNPATIVNSGTALTWTLFLSEATTTYISGLWAWWAYTASAPGSMTATPTITAGAGSYVSQVNTAVDVWAGANTTAPVGATHAGTYAGQALSYALTPNASGSALIMAACDGANTGTQAAGTNCYLLNTDATSHASGEVWYGTSGGFTPSTASTPETLAITGGTTSATFEYIAYEVLQGGTLTSPAWATSYDTTAVAGTGTWTNPANAEGTGGSGGPWATWTAP